ncbi:MAG: ArsA family ATPase [Bdellovibrionales bacterium]
MMNLISNHKVLICAGTGGVGKTSLSAALGVLAARNGKRTLVLTIDPAQRLAQSLGVESRPGQVTEVPGQTGLSAVMIDARSEFDAFVLGAIDKGLAKNLFENKLYQQLVSNLSGSQEFTSLARLLNSVQSGQYDLVILDTPPTQNAVDFLRAPDRLFHLFQDSVIGWFASPEEDENWLKKTFHRGTKVVTNALENVTGSKFIHELKDFFSHVSHLKGRISVISQQVRELLHSPAAGFVLVTGFDETKLKEALEFQKDLQMEGLNLRAIVVNRWFPSWTQGEHLWPESWQNQPDFSKLKEMHDLFANYFSHRQEVFERLKSQMKSDIPIVRLPEFDNAVQGLEDLGEMATVVEEKWRQG